MAKSKGKSKVAEAEKGVHSVAVSKCLWKEGQAAAGADWKTSALRKELIKHMPVSELTRRRMTKKVGCNRVLVVAFMCLSGMTCCELLWLRLVSVTIMPGP